MASTTDNLILLTVNGASRRPIYEAIADAALTPGELLSWSADDQLAAHSVAGGPSMKMFCVEDPYTNVLTAAAIDTDYASGETTRYIIAQPGDMVLAWLATSDNVAKGDALMADAAGALTAYTAQTVTESGSATVVVYHDRIVAYAAEDKNNTTGARCRIRVLVA